MEKREGVDEEMLGIFPSGNFPNVQFPKQKLPKSVLAASLALPPIAACSALESLASLSFGKYYNCEVALGKLLLGKSPFGKMPSGKYTEEKGGGWIWRKID